MAVVRVSKGCSDVSNGDQAYRVPAESEAGLREPLEALNGLLHYIGVDQEVGHIPNVSVWRTLADARQMDTSRAMLAQRPTPRKPGVKFDRITNQQPMRMITP